MKTLDDLLALELILPKLSSETPVAWVSRARASGIINEEEWIDACNHIKRHLYLWNKD